MRSPSRLGSSSNQGHLHERQHTLRNFPAQELAPGWRLHAGPAAGVLRPATASAHAALESSDPASWRRPCHRRRIRSRSPSPSRWSRPTAACELYDSLGDGDPGHHPQLRRRRLLDGAGTPGRTCRTAPTSVLWRTLSEADGHTAQNYIAFTIGTNADIAAVVIPAPATDADAVPQWAKTTSRWAALIGAVALIACWPVWTTVLPARALGDHGAEAVPIVRRMRRFALGAVACAVLGSVYALIVQAWTLAGWHAAGQDRQHAGANPLRASLAGPVRADRGLGAGACRLWLVVHQTPPGRRGDRLGAVAGARDPVQPDRPRFRPTRPVGRWRSPPMRCTSSPHRSGPVASRSWSSFSSWLRRMTRRRTGTGSSASPAGPASRPWPSSRWPRIGVTGFYAGWLQVGNLAALTTTGYGRALLVKLACWRSSWCWPRSTCS